jgi:hypothetical protein
LEDGVISVAIPPLKSDRVKSPGLYRFTVAQHHRMVEMGILTADDRVELLEGWIVPKMPHNPPHDGKVTRATRRLMPCCRPSGFCAFNPRSPFAGASRSLTWPLSGVLKKSIFVAIHALGISAC